MEVELRDHEGDHGSLPAQAQIWNHLFKFITSMSLKCALELRIPEAIHMHGGQPVTLPQLVSALGIPSEKAPFVHRHMRLLTHSGFFTVQSNGEEQEAYLLNSLSEHLLLDNPHSLSPFLLAILDAIILAPWPSLAAWFRSDSPTPFRHTHGASLWELASMKPELNSMFNEGMASDSRLTTDVAIREHGEIFRGLKSLVDVAGGTGAVAMALDKAFPLLKCTVLDLPHVISSARKSTDVDFFAGDMFESVPPADAVLLKSILHDWSDEQCVKLLKICREAIPPKEEGGKVIIIDMLGSEDPRALELRETQYYFDLLMMVLTEGGKERREEEWRMLFMDAGFSGYKITPLGLGLRAIIELFP